MTDKELHKLKRPELLDLLFYMRKELDELQAENESLKKQIENSEHNRELLEKIFNAVCPESEKESGT
ncbi:MAG: hypothetical protein NC205_05015 [Prevotella sp.]|nr:hypothetical protein [Alistipes senegalensis]MCM1357934.1 hypothetical protein [Prevotella sp.]MCM1473485.1 hypothetical protein [Muribaculaceae bacterium]MDE6426151.1 hypothetical protein [Ruminococcus sp.]